jgi:hypothetical protein
MEQLAARRAHNPKVAGSSPAPATKIYLQLSLRELVREASKIRPANLLAFFASGAPFFRWDSSIHPPKSSSEFYKRLALL